MTEQTDGRKVQFLPPIKRYVNSVSYTHLQCTASKTVISNALTMMKITVPESM